MTLRRITNNSIGDGNTLAICLHICGVLMRMWERQGGRERGRQIDRSEVKRCSVMFPPSPFWLHYTKSKAHAFSNMTFQGGVQPGSTHSNTPLCEARSPLIYDGENISGGDFRWNHLPSGKLQNTQMFWQIPRLLKYFDGSWNKIFW